MKALTTIGHSICLMSLFSAISFGQATDTIIIDDFDASLVLEWHSKKSNAETVYKIKKEAGNNYLAARSINDDNFIIKKIKVDLVQYPYLNWRWQAKRLPKKGDESKKKFCDVAACVNVVLKASRWRPRTIKYSWSSTLEAGTRSKSPFAIWPSRCDIIVVKSGDQALNKWHNEKRNVLEDYKIFYGKDKVQSLVIEAFVIMTDSDNTSSLSQANYDDIFFSTH